MTEPPEFSILLPPRIFTLPLAKSPELPDTIIESFSLDCNLIPKLSVNIVEPIVIEISPAFSASEDPDESKTLPELSLEFPVPKFNIPLVKPPDAVPIIMFPVVVELDPLLIETEPPLLTSLDPALEIISAPEPELSNKFPPLASVLEPAKMLISPARFDAPVESFILPLAGEFSKVFVAIIISPLEKSPGPLIKLTLPPVPACEAQPVILVEPPIPDSEIANPPEIETSPPICPKLLPAEI